MPSASPIRNRSPASIPQSLPRFQRVLDSLLGFLLSAERFESLALQVKDVLLAHRSSGSHMAAAEDFGDLGSQFHFILGDVVTLAHDVDAQLERGQNVFSGRGNIATRLR